MQIEQVTLSDRNMSVSLLNFGAITQGWWVDETPLILSYETPQAYLTDPYFLGAIVGRVANRIDGAGFDLSGVRYDLDPNEGRNTLHGGQNGLSRQVWDMQQVSASEAILSYVSPDQEGGFPGCVVFELRVSLCAQRLTYFLSAHSDRATPISIAQHNYYTLGSTKGVSELTLQLASDRCLDVDSHGIPTGQINQLTEGPMNYSKRHPVAGDVDHYFVFDPNRNPQSPVAQIGCASGYGLRVYSDQLGAQVYAGGGLSAPFHRGAGVCIEPSGYPNAPNLAAFPSVLCSPEQPYAQTLTLELTGG